MNVRSPGAPIGFDTETFLIAPGLLAPPLVCVSVSNGTVGTVRHVDDARAPVETLLRSTQPIVGTYLAFDMAVLCAQWPEFTPLVFAKYDRGEVLDITVREKLLDIARGERQESYSLQALVLRHFGVHLEKENTWRLRYAELRDVPLAQWPPNAVSYPIDDAHWPVRIWERQEAQATYLEDQHRQTRADFVFVLTSSWGIYTDPLYVRAYSAKCRADFQRLKASQIAAGFLRPDRTLKSGPRKGETEEGSRNKKAVQAALEAAYTARGLEVPRKPVTPKAAAKGVLQGNIKTDEATCIASGDPVLAKYGELSSLDKIIGSPPKGDKKATGDLALLSSGTVTPIQARFEVLLATGRTSTSPNIQNRPTRRGDRECFIPRPGHVFLSCDYGQIELRTLAQVCMAWFGHSRLAEILISGRDPHTEVAATILGTTYEDAMARAKHGDKDAYLARQTGKVCNFGFPGGLGPDALVHFAALSYKVYLTKDRAKALKQTWIQTLPEMGDYFARIGAMTGGEWAQIEQLYSKRFRGGVRYTQAANTMFQGLAADIAKDAGWRIAKACYVDTASPLYGSHMVNFVHDEWILEVSEARGHDAAQALEALMLDAARAWLPNVTPIVESTLMRRWSKGAKARRENGRLVPVPSASHWASFRRRLERIRV